MKSNPGWEVVVGRFFSTTERILGGLEEQHHHPDLFERVVPKIAWISPGMKPGSRAGWADNVLEWGTDSPSTIRMLK